MTLEGLDALDRHILDELQRDSRHASSRQIAATVSASPSTIRKRIQRLEAEGIVTAYRAEVDYERAGYQLYFQIVCTAPVPERAALADAGLDVPGVVGVRELATGERNLVFTVAGRDREDLTRIASELSRLGVTVLDEELILRDHAGRLFESASDRRPGGGRVDGEGT